MGRVMVYDVNCAKMNISQTFGVSENNRCRDYSIWGTLPLLGVGWGR